MRNLIFILFSLVAYLSGVLVGVWLQRNFPITPGPGKR